MPVRVADQRVPPSQTCARARARDREPLMIRWVLPRRRISGAIGRNEENGRDEMPSARAANASLSSHPPTADRPRGRERTSSGGSDESMPSMLRSSAASAVLVESSGAVPVQTKRRARAGSSIRGGVQAPHPASIFPPPCSIVRHPRRSRATPRRARGGGERQRFAVRPAVTLENVRVRSICRGYAGARGRAATCRRRHCRRRDHAPRPSRAHLTRDPEGDLAINGRRTGDRARARPRSACAGRGARPRHSGDGGRPLQGKGASLLRS